MGIFDRIRKRSPKTESKKAPEKDVRDEKKTDTSKTDVIRKTTPGGASSLLLVAPRVSEKAATLAGKGTYVFNVPVSANKVEIKKAVESLYAVSVTSVRTSRGIGKRMVRGRIAGQRNRWKKALITLKSGQKIELHEGV